MRLVLLCLTLCCSQVSAKVIRAAVGWDRPPYVIEKSESGFEIELTRQILAEDGHEFQPVFTLIGKASEMLLSGNIDMVLTIDIKHRVDPELLTEPYVVYQNVAVTLRQRAIRLSRVNELRLHSVIAFKDASNLLGTEFADTVKPSKKYLEAAITERQIKLLMVGSVDVVVMDRHILAFLVKKLPLRLQRELSIHPLFDVMPYRAAIIDPEIRAQFDNTLNVFMRNGRYQRLLDEFGLVNLLDKLPVRDGQFADSDQ
ncbi:substrate-binding periplasmic protein [Alteromonas sp. CYL-A6]|uniref:substrate-binding periplasmic protein n=1 Tax=Alteromonas nitratireducens TaxID=3390813 RepID=UPI0034A7F83C